ncbi:MAG: tape measure protein, partial [Waterburya sp.]
VVGKNAGSNFAKGFESQIDNLGNRVNKILDFAVGGILTNTLSSAFSSISNSLGSLGAGAVSIEQTGAAFQALVGDAGKANNLLKEIQKIGAETPFEFPELATASKSLIAFGIPLEQNTKRLRQIADISALSGSSIEGLAEVFAKITASGVIDATDVSQLANYGVTTEDLAKQIGKTSEEFVQLAKSGKLASDQLFKAKDLEAVFDKVTGSSGRFYQGAIRQSKTFGGILSNLSDIVGQTFNRFVGIDGGEVKDGIFKSLRDDVGNLVASLGSVDFTEFGQSLNGAYQSLKGSITGIYDTAQGLYNILFSGEATQDNPLFGLSDDTALVDFLFTVSDTVSGLYNILFKGDYTSPIFNFGEDSQVVDFLFRIRDAIGEVINKDTPIQALITTLQILGGGTILFGLASLATALFGVATAIAPFALIAGVIFGIILAIQNWSTVTTLLSQTWSSFLSFIQPAIGLLNVAFTNFFNYLGAGNIIITLFSNVWNLLVSAFNTALPFIVGIIAQLGFFAIQVGVLAGYMFNQLYPVFLQVVEAVGNLINALSPLIDRFIFTAGIITNVLLAAFNFAFPIIGAVVTQAFVAIGTLLAGFINVISGVVLFVTKLFTGDFKGAWDALGVIFRGGVQIITGIFQTLTAPIRGVFDGIFNLFTSFNLAQKALEWGQGFVNSVKDKFNEAVNSIKGILNNIKLPELKFPEIKLPSIGQNYMGTNNWGGGLTEIAERGRELFQTPNGMRYMAEERGVLDLPRGTRILSNPETERYLRSSSIANNQQYQTNNNQRTQNVSIYSSDSSNRSTSQRFRYAY